jgi:predicted permease
MWRWRTLASWCRSVVFRSRTDRDIDDELRFHVESEVESAMSAGFSREEARRLGHAGIGGDPAFIREACRDQRGVSWLDDFLRDVKHGTRLLRRAPGFTVTIVSMLAVAIGATVTVFSIMDAWLFRPLNFPHAHRLVVAFAARPERPREPAVWLPYRIFSGWQLRSRSFESVSAAFMRPAVLTVGSESGSALGMDVTPDFFRTFGVGPLLGSTGSFDVAGSQRPIVLSYGLWQRRFGGADLIGSPINVNDVPHDVVAVMPREFDTRVLDMRFEFWTRLDPTRTGYGPDGVGPVTVIGRLRDDVSVEAAHADLSALARNIESQHTSNFNRFVVNLTSLQADNARSVRATLLTVSAAVASLLLIAAVNVGTLLLGRGLARVREVAIRTAIGSGRARLVRQFLTESLLLALLGAIVGLALVPVAIWGFVAWNPLGSLPANAIRLDVRALGVACLAMAATALVSGLLPALRTSTAGPYETLRAGGSHGSSTAPGQRAQLVMLAIQVAASVVLLVATTLLIQTFVRLQSAPLGFNPRDLFVARVNLPDDPFDSSEKRNSFYEQLAPGLRTWPGVRGVAAATSEPLTSGPPVTVNTREENLLDAPRISVQEVTTEYFTALQIPLVAGRDFDGRDSFSGMQVAILNVRAVQDLFGRAEAAIGRRVRLDKESWREIVGVVGNVRSAFFNTLEWKTDPIVYRPALQGLQILSDPTASGFGFNLHIRSDAPLALEDLRKAAGSVSSSATITELRRVSDLIADATKQPAFRMTVLLWIATVLLLLAAIGVYGIVSQSVTQRTRELAIRLALGGPRAQIVATVIRRVTAVGIVGLALGIGAAMTLGNVLQALLYGVKPSDAVSIGAATAALVVVAGLAALVPAWRATCVDPARVLRGD